MNSHDKHSNLQKTTFFARSIHSVRRVAEPHRLIEGAPCIFMPADGESMLVADFGRMLVGDPEADVRCEGSCTVSFYYGETSAEALRTAAYDCGWYVMPKDVFSLSAGSHRIRSNGRRAFRYLCVRVTGADTEISLRMADSRYPVQRKGSFCCSDPLLNRIWDACAETVSCCMQQYYEDGVKRDGLLWIGDYRLTFPSAWYAFGDSALAAKSLRMIAASQRPDGSIPGCASNGGGHQHPGRIEYMPGIPHGSVGEWLILNYCTDFVSAVREYAALTGDCALARELYPAVRRLMDFLTDRPLTLALTPDGLRRLDAPGTPDIDYEIFVDCRTDPNGFIASPGAFLFMLARAMGDCAWLAGLAGDPVCAQQQSTMREQLLQTIRARFYDPAADLYRDREDRPIEAGQPLYAAAHGILCGALTDAAPRLLAGAPLGVYPYFTAWNLSAMFESGQGEAALDAIRRHWGAMLSKDGPGTCWERLDADLLAALHPLDASCSLCHGWGAHPAYQLPAHILGIHPVSAGFADTVAEPRLYGLDWAEGTVPTPRGPLWIRVEKTSSGTEIDWKIPDSLRCTLKTGSRETKISGAGTIRTDFSL